MSRFDSKARPFNKKTSSLVVYLELNHLTWDYQGVVQFYVKALLEAMFARHSIILQCTRLKTEQALN
jgi:hypothetical protein